MGYMAYWFYVSMDILGVNWSKEAQNRILWGKYHHTAICSGN